MSNLLRVGLPCSECGSRDNGSIYQNTDTTTGENFYLFKCFGGACGHTRRITSLEDYETMTQQEPRQTITGLLPTGVFTDLRNAEHPWGNRNIAAETCQYFGVSVLEDCPQTQNPQQKMALLSSNLPTTGAGLILPFYDDKGNCIAQKVRTSVNKKGSWYKTDDNALKRVGFFGQQMWKSDAIHDIVITFGELDALAVYQMLGTPVVSVTNGDGSAPAQFKAQYNWLQRFNNIILIPDNDESCQAVIPLLGAIFPRKIRIVSLHDHKDPNEYLQNNARDKFVTAFYASQPFTPEKIISLGSLHNLLFEDPPTPIASYPWEGLNKMTGGIWPGELITCKAPPKIGKSTFFTEIASHLYHTTDKPIGLIYLEETQRDLIFRFASIKLNKNLQRMDILANTTREELQSAAEELMTDDRIYVVDHWGSCSSDFLEDKMKEFVLSKGCQFIFFDHISMAITDESNKDERLALDRLISSIKALTVGLPDEEYFTDPVTGVTKTRIVTRQPTIFMITHVNDNGQPRGSRAALQISNLVIGLQRDKMNEDLNVRNMLRVFVEENRRYGETGLASNLNYNSQTGRLIEVPVVEVHLDD